MAFMVVVLIITIVLVPVIIYWIRWLHRQWCLSEHDKFKSEDYRWYIEVLIRFLAVDILVLVCDLAFIIELLTK